MSDKKPNEPGQQTGTPAANAKANGTTPTVTARRPISKDEYARTTKSSPDATSVIPAVRDDQPAPAPKSRPEVDDRPTQTFQAVTDAGPAAPKAPQPEQKKPEPKKPEQKKAEPKKPEAKKAEKPAKQEPPKTDPVAPVSAVASAGGVAGAAASAATPTAPAAATSAPTAPSPAAPATPKQPEQKKPLLKRPEPKSATTKVAPAATEKKADGPSADSAAGRSARLKLSHIEPWSVTKMAFVVSVALMVVSVVAVTVFWIVLQMTGVWGALNDSVSNVLADDAAAFDITDYLGFGRVVGVTLLISSLNVIFMTALATIAAHLYNLAAGILGGIELTFGERK